MSVPHAHARGDHGKPLVLLHGIGGDGTIWQPQLDAWSDRFRLFAWDMPGYGKSERLYEMSFPALAEALVALLDELELERAHLVGHSMGGMLAQAMTALHPERVASLVLCATSASFGPPGGDFQRQWVKDRLAPLDAGQGMDVVARDAIARLIGDEPDPEGIALAERCMSAVSEASYRAAVRCVASFDQRETLDTIAVPTLLVAGEKDPSAPLKAMQRMEAGIPGAQLVCLEGAGHLVPMERPQAFNETVARFLGGLA